MIILGKDSQPLYGLDLSKGEVKEVFDREVVYRYIVTRPGLTEETVIAEYPNGGKDVEIIEIQPQEGVWKMLDAETKGELHGWQIECDTDNLPRDRDTYGTVQWGYWSPYTEEQLEAIEAEQQEAAELKEAINAAPARIDEVEAMQGEIAELIAEIMWGE